MMPIDPETTWIQTYSGKKFWPLNPRPEDVDILDIAHALSNKCRFTGHCDRFYSVAQHSIAVYRSFSTAQENANNDAFMLSLLHDAAEAYMPDIASPIKAHIPGIPEMEDKILKCIVERFGINADNITKDDLEKIASVDRYMLYSEAFWLMPRKAGDWGFGNMERKPTPVIPVVPTIAESEFLASFVEAGGRLR